MVSTFDELVLTIKEYPFDVVTMSETWLKNNSLLLQHVTIPGYSCEFRNRESVKGGGVGAYIKESVKYKRRTDIEAKEPDLEHLWLEFLGRNKNNKLLLGIMYRSNKILTPTTWLDSVENLFSYLTTSWNGQLLVTGDMNIDLMPTPLSKQYLDMLLSLNLHQHVGKPTRTTNRSSTRIDHIISNTPERTAFTDVLPCPLLSDHDAVYACISIKVTRFQPRYKCIRDERHFDESIFREDFSKLPFSIINAFPETEEKLDILNSLITGCIDRHASLKRVNVTRPPAPWMKDPSIQLLQEQRNALRAAARKTGDSQTRAILRETRNELKKKIRTAKKSFIQKALSSKKTKAVWKIIRRVLHRNPQRINFDPDKLNTHFASTAERIAGISYDENDSPESIINLIESLPPNSPDACDIRLVHQNEVFQELRNLRTDSSSGSDQIPAKLVKMVAEDLAPPLANINSCIGLRSFPAAWKIARICSIPKTNVSASEDDFRPISVLPVLSKVYERLIFRQLAQHIDENSALYDSVSAYRKGQSTITVLQAIRDDILKAMKRGEVTMMVLADFSKAFDTVRFGKLITKMYQLGLSKNFLTLMLNYVSDRKQFV
ncbi:Hypothetical predicted protein [Paramuricea clavata]|uniref:Uncharacterized protein n=1 Tax=Paramuricea clavata TaxID=317549 RepID=A0A7D9I3X9_PARCT|nr:Hypothetical predicted protein [Paramuricea clavata]